MRTATADAPTNGYGNSGIPPPPLLEVEGLELVDVVLAVEDVVDDVMLVVWVGVAEVLVAVEVTGVVEEDDLVVVVDDELVEVEVVLLVVVSEVVLVLDEVLVVEVVMVVLVVALAVLVVVVVVVVTVLEHWVTGVTDIPYPNVLVQKKGAP